MKTVCVTLLFTDGFFVRILIRDHPFAGKVCLGEPVPFGRIRCVYLRTASEECFLFDYGYAAGNFYALKTFALKERLPPDGGETIRKNHSLK